MTSWASVPRTRAPRAALPPSPSTPAGVRSAALAVTGALLTASAATCALPLLGATPVQAQEPVPAQVPAQQPAGTQGRTVVFDYSAEVVPNDVYDTERAQAPLPLFRALGDRVDVEADYTGPEAVLGLAARLSSTTGWSTTVPLANEVEVEGRGRVRATVDLRRLEDRAALVATQTEMPFEGMTVELVATVRDDTGTWTPSVALQLTPQQLRLTGEPSTLTVRQEGSAPVGSATPAAPTPQSRLDDLLGWRPDGLLTTLVLGAGLAGAGVVVRRRQEEDDASRARRLLGRLLLDVRPADLDGLRAVHVAGPEALARLAERYGLLVLHWTDDAGEVFVVQDETTAYCWATGEWPEGPRAQARRQEQPADDSQAAEAARVAERAAAEAARRKAEQAAEAARREAARREAERRHHAEAAERARAEVARAQAARVEAERVEQQRRAEAEQAAQAWAAIERAYAQERAGIVVPAPRRAPEQLADRPPREADGPAGPSLFEVG